MPLVLDDLLSDEQAVASVVEQPVVNSVPSVVEQPVAQIPIKPKAKVMKHETYRNIPKVKATLEDSDVIDARSNKPAKKEPVTVADPTPSVENASLSVPIGEEVAPVLSAEEQLLQLVTQEELDPEKKKIRENLLGLVGRYSESKRLAPKLKGIIPADYQIYPIAALEQIIKDIRDELAKDDNCSILGMVAQHAPGGIEQMIKQFNPYGVGYAAEGLVERLESNTRYCDAREEILIEHTTMIRSGPWMRLAKHGLLNAIDVKKVMKAVPPVAVPVAVPVAEAQPVITTTGNGEPSSNIQMISQKYRKIYE